MVDGAGFEQGYGFTGRYLDGETGLWYFRARYFDSGLGRFVSRDPLGYVDGDSLYASYFAALGVDPSGTKTVIIPIYYEPKEGDIPLTDRVKAEMMRLIKSCMDRKASRVVNSDGSTECPHRVFIQFFEVDREPSDDRMRVTEGGGTLRIPSYVTGDLPPNSVTGHSERNNAQYNPTLIREAAKRAGVSVEVVLGVVLAHELFFHGDAHMNTSFHTDALTQLLGGDLARPDAGSTSPAPSNTHFGDESCFRLMNAWGIASESDVFGQRVKMPPLPNLLEGKQ